jgi:hypothetical protein
MKVINLEKIWFYNILLISMFPLLPKGAESVLMFLFFVFSVFLCVKKKLHFNRRNIKGILSISFLFFLYILTSFYANNKSDNIKFIILTLPLFLFPLSFGILAPDLLLEKRIHLIKIVFIFSTLFSLLITNIFLYYRFPIEVSQWEYRNAFENFTKVHGTYFSLWIGFSTILLFNYLFNELPSRKKTVSIITILLMVSYFTYWQITINARLPLMITLLIIITIFIKSQKPNLRKVLFILILFFTTILVILKFNDLKNKLNINLPEGKYEVMHKTMNSEEIRAGIYFCSLTLIKDSWLFGHGIGDVNDKLNECYKEKIKSDVYQTFYYNSHNQYIQAFLVGGIFSFLFFLLSLIYLLKTAILKNDKSFIFFIVLIICCFFTENILSRHDGVLFFSFFSSIFYFKKTV